MALISLMKTEVVLKFLFDHVTFFRFLFNENRSCIEICL